MMHGIRWMLDAYLSVAPRAGVSAEQVCQDLLAIVLRRDRPIVQLDLGPAVPIREAVETWHQVNLALDLGRGPGSRERVRPRRPGPDTRLSQDDATPEQVLRRLVWEPLVPHLDGVRTVLVSPDGALARFPLGALPTDDPLL